MVTPRLLQGRGLTSRLGSPHKLTTQFLRDRCCACRLQPHQPLACARPGVVLHLLLFCWTCPFGSVAYVIMMVISGHPDQSVRGRGGDTFWVVSFESPQIQQGQSAGHVWRWTNPFSSRAHVIMMVISGHPDQLVNTLAGKLHVTHDGSGKVERLGKGDTFWL